MSSVFLTFWVGLLNGRLLISRAGARYPQGDASDDGNSLNTTAGNVSVEAEGVVLVGSGSPIGLLPGSYTQTSDGVMEVGLAGTGPGQFGLVDVFGTAMLGGTLDVSLLGGYTLSPGQSFKIINVGGSLSGQFSGLSEGGLIDNFGGADLFITYAAGDGNDVALFTEELPGDFDLDFDVDGCDFLKWQQGESPNPLSQSDLNDWQTNFGNVVSPITAASAMVPEPATWMMLMLGMAVTTVACLRRPQTA